MREHLVAIIFSCLSVIYSVLYARDYLAQRAGTRVA